MSIKRARLVKALGAKGFRADGGTGHDKYRLFIDGKRSSVMTLLSRGTQYQDLGDSLVGKIARQMYLDKAELMDFVECSLSGEGYLQLIRDRLPGST